jgi:peptide/nickel transport system permease protein
VTTLPVSTPSPAAVALRTPKRRGLPARLVSTPQTAVAAALLVVVVVAVVVAPLIAPAAPDAIDPAHAFAAPSVHHLFGTDELGRDLLSRMLYGGRYSLGIAGCATAIAMVLGVTWGFVAAESGGWLDELLMRVVDVAMAVPIVLFGLILVAAFGASVTTLAVIIGMLLSPGTARIARAAVLAELKSDYCLAAVAAGVPRGRLLFGELLPNAGPVLIARASLVAADALMIEASLSFLGLGIAPPAASWGTLLQQGYANIFSSLAYVTFPGLVIFASIWVFNTLGDRLQAILDPRSAR